MSNPVFNGCGEVLAYSAIAVWLVTWGIRRIKYNKHSHDKQIKGWLNKPENKNYLLSVIGNQPMENNTIPEDIRQFMARLNAMNIGDSFLESVIPEDSVRLLIPSVQLGLLSMEHYKDIGDVYTITLKGKSIS